MAVKRERSTKWAHFLGRISRFVLLNFSSCSIIYDRLIENLQVFGSKNSAKHSKNFSLKPKGADVYWKNRIINRENRKYKIKFCQHLPNYHQKCSALRVLILKFSTNADSHLWEPWRALHHTGCWFEKLSFQNSHINRLILIRLLIDHWIFDCPINK